MTEAFRVVEHQSRLYPFRAARSAEKAAYLASLLEATKPQQPYAEWHPLIATPFRYPLPVQPKYAARFRPPYGLRNVLYCSREPIAALYEHAYHFLKERMHLADLRESGQRTIFSLFIVDDALIADVRERSDVAAIMARDSYDASHEFVKSVPDAQAILYPSCRDPERRANYAALDITALHGDIGEERTLSFYFDQPGGSLFWTDAALKIPWQDVR